MEEIDNIYGFPVIYNKEEQTLIIKNNCGSQHQNRACRKLYQLLEQIYILYEKLQYPLRINEWIAVLEPTDENIEKYYSAKGISTFITENKIRLNNTITFFKPEVNYYKNQELPNLIFHFFQVSYDGKLDIDDSFELSDRCFINYKDTKQFTPLRIKKLQQKGIDYKMIKDIPLLPIERIQFDKNGKLVEFKHTDFNKTYE